MRFFEAVSRPAPGQLLLRAALVSAVGLGAVCAPAAHAQDPGCGAPHFVASWTASPTDAITPTDASDRSVPLTVDDRTFRMIVTPHLGGDQLRVRLTNRFGLTPVTFGAVTIGRQVSGAVVADTRPVLFGGAASTTVAPGADIVSDPVTSTAAAFQPLAISIHVPSPAGPPTKHWNANATSYYTAAGSGDRTADPSADTFSETTGAWFYVDSVDVLAPAATGAVVAFGDSITDGFVGTNPRSIPVDPAAADVNGRYPDVLQRRLDAAGIPISVVNAGIGSNRLLVSGEPILMGPSGLSRFDRDALDQSGVTGVLVQEGINDLGLPPHAAAPGVISALQQLVARARTSGKKIWLGTLLPASGALIHGDLLAPEAERDRRQINTWIRTQTVADGVVDFDAAIRDPANPAVPRPEYVSVDQLHPSLEGYRVMADAVSLAMLRTAAPAC